MKVFLYILNTQSLFVFVLSVAALFIQVPWLVSSDTDFKIVSTGCEVEPTRVVNVSCRVKALSRERSEIMMDADLIIPLHNVTLHVQFFKKDYSNNYRPFLINFTINACDVLAGKTSTFYSNVGKMLLAKYSNLNHTCPYEGHLMMHHFYLEPNFLSNKLMDPPEGSYKIFLRFFEGYPYEFVGDVVLYIDFIRTTIRRPHYSNKKNISSTNLRNSVSK